MKSKVYKDLQTKLGRPPTPQEIAAEVERILESLKKKP